MGLQIWHITCFHGGCICWPKDHTSTHMGLEGLQTTVLVNFMPHSHTHCSAHRQWLLSGLDGRVEYPGTRLSGPQNLKYFLSTFMGKVCRPPGIQSRCPIHLGNSQTHPQQVWLNCSQCSVGNVMSKGSWAVHMGCRSLGGYEPHSVPLPPSFLCPHLAT